MARKIKREVKYTELKPVPVPPKKKQPIGALLKPKPPTTDLLGYIRQHKTAAQLYDPAYPLL